MIGGAFALASAAFGAAPLGMEKALQVIVGDEDRTGKLTRRGVEISEALQSRGTCTLSLNDVTKTWHPAVGMPITVLHHGARKFAGTINDVEEEIPSRDPILFTRLRCVDHNQFADRFTVAALYENQTLREIVEDIVFSQTPMWQDGIRIDGVQDGPTIGKAIFEYKTVKQCFDKLTEISGLAWKIDHHKVIHFFDRAAFTAPWNISDSAKKHSTLRYTKTRSQYRNTQWLRAGNDLTDASLPPEVIRGVAVSNEPDKRDRTFVVKYPVGTVPTITRGGVAQRVGVRGVDKDGDLTAPSSTTWPQWFYQIGSNEISQNSAQDTVLNPVLTDGERLEVDYQGQIPMVLRSESAVEIAARISVEGGSGIYEHVESDTDLDGRDFAAEKTERLLALYGRIPGQINFSTTEQGLSPGHLQSVVLANHGINAQFMVESIRTSWVATLANDEEFFEYSVSGLDGESQGGWADFFRKLADAGRKVSIDENEKFVISRGVRETLTMADTFTDSINNGATLTAYTDDMFTFAIMAQRTQGSDTQYGFQMGRSVIGRPHGS